MATAGPSKRLTYEEYLALPETNCRYEILDGKLTMTPSPNVGHNRFAHNIYYVLDRYVLPRGLGWPAIVPADVLVHSRPLRTRQPDVYYVSKERSSIETLEEFLDLERLEVGPELVVEVLSASDRPALLQEKLDDYCALGVQECWLVRRSNHTVEVLRLSPAGEQSIGTYGMGETVRSEVLPGLELPVDDVFA